jgi:branched-chain amino acid aminotransferase
VSSWRRIGDNSLSPSVKATANYLNSVLAKTEAGLTGHDEAILLNERGLVSEATGENIFLVQQGTLVTPTATSAILEGITRDSVMHLARAERLPIVEREVTRAELYSADELFFTGTAAEISPVLEVDGRTVGSGQVGPITSRLQTAFAGVVNGRAGQFRHWLTPVY